MNGAFLMSREIFDHDVFTDIKKFRIFFWIIGHAVFSEKGVVKGGVRINRGQYLRSYRNLREDLVYFEKNAEKYYSLSTIKDKVENLVEDGSLIIEETRLGTLFTVVNYEQYQGFERYKNTEKEEVPNTKRTATEQQQNTNGTPNEQQPNNKNLGIKDIKAINATTAANTNVHKWTGPTDYQRRLLDRFVQLRGGFDSNVDDQKVAAEIEQEGVPLELALQVMEKKFADYKPRHSRDKISKLAYCAGAIYDIYHQPAAMPQKTPEQQKQDQEYNYGF